MNVGQVAADHHTHQPFVDNLAVSPTPNYYTELLSIATITASYIAVINGVTVIPRVKTLQ